MNEQRRDLLIEIGVEELPPKSLRLLSRSFRDQIVQGLTNLQLPFSSASEGLSDVSDAIAKSDPAEIKVFATPRRLALLIPRLVTLQAPQHVLKKGPLLAAAFDKDGKPTPAALGFASACQTPLEALKTQQTEKGECLVYEQTLPAQATATLISKLVQDALKALPLPKHMRWGELKESFVRPVHWLVLLFGEQVIPAEFFGIKSDRMTYGHRFHHPAAIPLKQPSEYEDRLRNVGKVIADFEERRELIETNLKNIAAEENASASIDEELLDQVTGLVEWPVVLLGQFDEAFLALPPEVLISSMQVHQKCFPLPDKQGKLLAKFLIVSNIESSDPLTVVQGNERVMQARLHDAAFFYQVDKETRLEARQEDLKKVVFQNLLGGSTLWDKSNRIKGLSKFILSQIPPNLLDKSTEADCERAALLCKTDLLTQMVGEFPELQGIMGRYYAIHDGESEAVARAIADHYHPRFANDSLPETVLGKVLALSDRIDTLVGMFGLGKHPTGDKDPYALRRQALAVLRIIGIGELSGFDLDLNQLFLKSKELYGNSLSTDVPIIQSLLEFCFERLRGWYLEQGEIPARVFEAVLAKRPTRPVDFARRLLAVIVFQSLPEAESLAAANKRVRNILAKSDVPIPPETSFDNNLLTENAEKQLAKAIFEKKLEIAPLLQTNQYTQALKSLATLKEPIDQFFDSVMVMVEDVPLRNNRLKLLNQLRSLFLEIADISLL